MIGKVSIIIPVFRAEETIEKCVLSLINGTYKNIEILLIEDCSPDGSWIACQRLQESYPCVRAFRNEKNCGVSATRNRGLQEMTGQYLMFVDSDDWVEADFVESFINAHYRYQPDLIVCGYINHDEVQSAAADYFGWKDSDEIIVTGLKNELLPMMEGRLLQQIWNKLFVADIVKKRDLQFDTNINMGEDFRFLLSYLEQVQGNEAVLINKPLYHYIRCSGNSLMSRFGGEKIDESLENLDRLYKLLDIDTETRKERLFRDRNTQVELWAYLIMHNMGMPHKEKRRLILNLDTGRGKKLYRQNLITYWKERIAILFKKIGFR